MKEFSPRYQQEGTAALKASLYSPYENTCRIIAFPHNPSSNWHQNSCATLDERFPQPKKYSLYKSLEGIPFDGVSSKRTFWVGLLIGSISILFASI